jgi:hypothetical protein
MIYENDNEHDESEKIEQIDGEDMTKEEEKIETEDSEKDSVPTGVTRSGNTFRDFAASNLEQHPLKLTKAEINFHNRMNKITDIACVGAGIGRGFKNTTELHVMKYDGAMKSPDAGQWQSSVQEEHDRMVDSAYIMFSISSSVSSVCVVLTPSITSSSKYILFNQLTSLVT